MKAKLLVAGICIMLCGIWMPSVAVSADELEEKEVYLTQEEMKEMVEESIEGIFTRSAAKYDLNWKIPGNTRAGSTSYFHKDKGEEVVITVELTKSAEVGILGLNGLFQYVEGKSVDHIYSAKKSQSYCICINNTNSSSLEAKGFYIR